MILRRDDQTSLRIFGMLEAPDGVPLCQTLELPWRDNAPNVSCIPAGTYTAVRFASPHFGMDVFQLHGVPGREATEIHPGNTVNDIRGCILVGVSRGTLDGLDAVLHSRTAFAALMTLMATVQSFPLEVIDP